MNRPFKDRRVPRSNDNVTESLVASVTEHHYGNRYIRRLSPEPPVKPEINTPQSICPRPYKDEIQRRRHLKSQSPEQQLRFDRQKSSPYRHDIVSEQVSSSIGNTQRMFAGSQASQLKSAPKRVPSQTLNKDNVVPETKKSREHLSASNIKDLILSKVILIRHDDVVYAYNGRTYEAINNVKDLVSVVVNKVDPTMFNLSSTRIFESVLTLLQVKEDLTPTDYNKRMAASSDIIVFKNTLFNIRTLEPIPFNPWYLTFFELDAVYLEDPSPDVYLEFLETVSPEESVRDRISDLIAYLLSGKNCAKQFYVMGTAPDSGKSTIAKFIQQVLGPKNVFNVATHEFKDRFALGGSRGKLLNIAMDLPAGKLPTDVVSTLKNISGSDYIMHQDKFKDKQFSVLNLRILLGTNHSIEVNPADNNDAFWQRLEIIPFCHSIQPNDKNLNLIQDLFDERDHIVSYCMQRMPDLILRDYKLTPCDIAEEMKNEWRYGPPCYDSIEGFCNSALEITQDENDYILTTELYEMYSDFCKTIDIKKESSAVVKSWFLAQPGVSSKRGRPMSSGNPKTMLLGIKKRDYFEEE